jgi:Ca2+-transporting ATPase
LDPSRSLVHSTEKPLGSRVETRPWHTLDLASAAAALSTSLDVGLSESEAAERLARFGPNELHEAPRPGFWHNLIDQFNNFIVIVLIVASIVSAVLGDYFEAAAIMAIVVLNAALGVIQEQRAEQALAALRKLAAPDAYVIRDGHRRKVPSRQMVPGDVVLLEAGNYTPADLRLAEAVNLRVDESALTGESRTVSKETAALESDDASLGDRMNLAYSGTLIAGGRGKGLVVATGMQTELGRIAGMISEIETEQTPLQRRLDQLGRILGWGALAICGAVFVAGWIRGFDPLEMFLVAVSLAVAAVPEGLPAVVTITLALGMREMITRNALIRRLSSVETLGSTTVICSDKTGTLTQNRMSVTRVWVDGKMVEITGAGDQPRGDFRVDGQTISVDSLPALTTALWVAALNNDAVIERGDGSSDGFRVVGEPTEAALMLAAAKAGVWVDSLYEAYPRIEEIPFDSGRKRMTTIHSLKAPRPEDASPFYDQSYSEWEVAATKGAPEVILELCSHYQTADDTQRPLTDDVRADILKANESMARQALRVLAVAYRVEADVPGVSDPEAVERDLTFVGLMGMIDPPREEVRHALDTADQAGIRTVMITGDYPDTARAVAEQIGLLKPGHEITTGRELAEMDDETLRQRVMQTDVFARVSPEHKVRIVDALKANRQVVAMTGDGVNDAPALKRADIGVAMGITGTDVAKETADMVLTDDNYVSIVSAVEQGRIIYANIRKFVYYLLSCNVAEIMTIFLAILMGLPSPLTAIQLLWLNLITDGAPALALGMEKGDPDTMDKPPRPPDEPIINRMMRVGISVQTVAITAATLTAYLIGLRAFPEHAQIAETMAFATLSFSELLRAFTARSETFLLFRLGVFSNPAMVLAFLSSLILLLVVVYVPALEPIFDTYPLTLAQWEIILPLLIVPSIAAELTKWLMGRTVRRPASA